MNIMKITISVVLLLITFQSCLGKTLNVKDFGAVGNGKVDDTQAILNCFKQVKSDGINEVVFPAGNYLISKPIDVFLSSGSLIITGESKSLTKIKNINQGSVITIRGFYSLPSMGEFKMSDLTLAGEFPIYSSSNRFINKPKFYYGVMVSDLKSVTITNIKVEGIYGEGISIFTTKSVGSELSSRFQSVNISNNEILNCWGYDPKTDSYGDGIYIANASKGTIKGNKVLNDFSKTKQFGRSGIVVEYYCSNISLLNNRIFGYDRGIHFEGDFGGHLIEGNNIGGSDLGLVFYNVNKNGNKPVVVKNNIISNNGLKKGLALKRTRGIDDGSGRSLMNFYAPNGQRSGSIIENNQFIVDGNYDFNSNSIMNIYSNGVKFNNNVFTVKNSTKHIVVNYNSSVNVSNENYNGVKTINLKKSNSNLNFNKINKLNSALVKYN